MVELLLEKGALVHITDEEGNTPLHTAIGEKQVKIVELLLKVENAPIDNTNAKGDTPLHMSAYRTQVETAKLLLNSGAKTDILNKAEETPLHAAVRERSVELIKLLLRKGAQINIFNALGDTPVDLALTMPDKDENNVDKVASSEILSVLLEKGIPLQSQSQPTTSQTKYPLLSYAAREGKSAHVKALIERGYPVDWEPHPKAKFLPPLHEAIQNGRVEIAKMLIRNRENTDLMNHQFGGRRPLHIAAFRQDCSAVKLLLDNGADPTERTGDREKCRCPKCPFKARGLKPACILRNISRENKIRDMKLWTRMLEDLTKSESERRLVRPRSL